MTREEATAKIRQLFSASEMTHIELATYLNVNAATIHSWSAGTRVPPPIVLDYITEKINKYLRKPECNAEVIREMTDEKLVEFLCGIRDDALNAQGDINLVCDEYKDFNLFLKSTELIE